MAKRLYGFRAEDCKARVWRKSLRAKLSLQDGQSDKVAKPWRRVSPMVDTGPISMALSETMADGRQGRLKRASTTCSVSRAAAPPGGPAVLVFFICLPIHTKNRSARDEKGVLVRADASAPDLVVTLLDLCMSPPLGPIDRGRRCKGPFERLQMSTNT